MFDRMPPVHPGEILLEEFLKPIGLSQTQLALATGMPQSRVQAIVSGRRGITADTAIRLAAFFGNTPQFWLNCQTSYELDMADYTGMGRRSNVRRRMNFFMGPSLLFLFKVFGEFASRTVFHRIVPCRFGRCARHFFSDGKRGRRFGVHYGSG